MAKGGGLTYALIVTILTCAFSLLPFHHTSVAAAIPEEFKIRQVTDGRNPTTTAHGGSNHHLLGTPTEHRFKSFIQEYNKEYSTREEYIHRLGVFVKNLLRAAEHQTLDPTVGNGRV
uniref:Cathepsin propeptide inhibitor domain-containing protein n=1 Tax=Solanum lycopersicum TaxID=4081 RepID=A0A3Q7HZD0_SOLLC